MSAPSTDLGFGTDVSTLVNGDLDPFFGGISGPRVVAEAVVRRWTTPTGGLFFDPAFGKDVRLLLAGKVSPQVLFAWRAALVAQAEDDDRVLGATVDIEALDGGRRLFIRAVIETAAGSFPLVVSVTDLTVDLIEPS